jgi:hypothetical protein
MVQNNDKRTTAEDARSQPVAKPYVTPALVRLGQMAEVTEKSGGAPDASMTWPSKT